MGMGCPLACRWCHNSEGISPEVELTYRKDRCTQCGHCVEACEQNALRLTGEGIVRNPGRCEYCFACAQTCPTESIECLGKPMTVTRVMDEIQKDIAFYDQSGGGLTFCG